MRSLAQLVLVCLLGLTPVLAANFDTDTRVLDDPPLTATQRVEVLFHNDFASPGAFFRSAGPATGLEMGNDPPEWGKTGSGYLKRVGMLFTVQTTADFTQAGMAALLHRDPRYQKCACMGGWHRAGHALAGAFVSADSHGHLSLDPSNLIGSYAGGFAGASLYPARYSITAKGVQLGNQNLGQSIVQNVILEFSPELKHFFTRTLLFKK